MDLSSLKSSVILPDHALWKWKRMAAEVSWKLRIGAEKEGVIPFRIHAKDWCLSGKAIPGNYPNYRQVIPPRSDFKSRVAMPSEVTEAIAALIPKLPGKKIDNKPVGIHVEKGLVSVLARETTCDPWQFYPVGNAEVQGPDQVAFANRDYIQRAAQFGLTEMSLIDGQSPMQFSRKGDLMIVMPVRVSNADGLKRPDNVKPIVSSKFRGSTKKVTKKPARKASTTSATDSDPIHDVEARIAEVNDALTTAGRKLASARGSLKTVRDQRSEDQKELKGFRSLFRSIRKMATGSN
jgi:hypothetical protein